MSRSMFSDRSRVNTTGKRASISCSTMTRIFAVRAVQRASVAVGAASSSKLSKEKKERKEGKENEWTTEESASRLSERKTDSHGPVITVTATMVVHGFLCWEPKRAMWRKLTLSDAHTTGENLDESIFTRVTKCHKKHAFTRSRPLYIFSGGLRNGISEIVPFLIFEKYHQWKISKKHERGQGVPASKVL